MWIRNNPQYYDGTFHQLAVIRNLEKRYFISGARKVVDTWSTTKKQNMNLHFWNILENRSNMSFVKQFEHNSQGRDFVVGDIHGCYDQLLTLMHHIKFDKSKDRLFSCGDIIDRGRDSLDCAYLIFEPWFHMVLGNHEQFMIESLLSQDDWMKYQATRSWMHSGGMWQSMLSDVDQTELLTITKEIAKSPLMIVVGKDTEHRFNIVHGELPPVHCNPNITDEQIDQWTLCQGGDHQSLTWGRNNISMYKHTELHPFNQSKDLSITFCGHNVVKNKPIVIGRQMYIDQGAGFGPVGTNMTIVEPKEKIAFMYNFQDENIYQLPFSCFENYTSTFGDSDE